MAQYILKSTLVAEIESRICDIEMSQRAGLIKKRDAETKITIFKSIFSLIDTLEVKEVDLEKEIGFYIETSLTGTNPIYTKGAVSCIIEKTAKDFFELGMAVGNKAQKGEKV